MIRRRTRPAAATSAAGAAVIAMAISFVGGWEGLRTSAYLDVVGVPTVCYGETKGVRIGDRYSKEECDRMFGERLVEFENEVRACVPGWDARPVKVRVTHLSLAYNIGSPRYCQSTPARHLKAGSLVQACETLGLYNKGRINGELVKIRGLVNRRNAEIKLCLEGVREGTTVSAPAPEGEQPSFKPSSRMLLGPLVIFVVGCGVFFVLRRRRD